MYKIIVFSVLLTAFLNTANAQAGNQQEAASRLANYIADKMKDSLLLSSVQRDQVFSINVELHNRKMAARSITSNRDSLSISVQQIENKRDSLYARVLSEQQLGLYKQKKRSLISNRQ
jgi:hypothetical protein